MSAPHVTTGGGASIGENVNAGGDFTGRDKVTYGDDVHGDKVTGDKIIIRKVPDPPISIIWLGLIVVICSFLLFIANEATLPFWPKTFHPFSLPLLLISFVFVFCMSIWKFWARHSKENTSDLRGKLLDAVFTTWLDPDYGILSQSVYSIARVNLILEIDVKAVDSHGKQFTQPSIQSKQLILAGTDCDKDLEDRPSVSIIQAYEKFAGKMLILGKPGSGKTTLLLELASELIKRAKKDYSQPIPVIFHLSTWASRKDPFEQWLVTELTKFYGLSTNIAEDLIFNNKIVLLLDGLDEMEEHARQDCVGAINHYRSNGRGLYPIVICCRSIDYERLHLKFPRKGGGKDKTPAVAPLPRSG